MIFLAAGLIASLQGPAQPSEVECRVIRAAVLAELQSERHLATRLRLTAAPNEWIVGSVGDATLKADPKPRTNMPALSLASCDLPSVFEGVWRVRKGGAVNLSLVSEEPVLTSNSAGMDDVLVSRATIEDATGRATVLFGGACGSYDVVTVVRDGTGQWTSLPPRGFGFMICDIVVTRHRK